MGPVLADGATYAQVVAGSAHTVLLKSDGTAASCGSNGFGGQCDIPVWADGATYTQVAAGWGHTVLLKSDGTAVACGSNHHGQCNIPALGDGSIYVQACVGARLVWQAVYVSTVQP